MFQDTITVYNKYVEAGTEKWQRTVIVGVFWNAIKGATTRKTGVQSADSVQLIIPATATASRSAHEGPLSWVALTDKSRRWTLQSGDVVILGNIGTEIVRSSKELLSYDNRIVITSVDSKRFGGGMAHWEVSGR